MRRKVNRGVSMVEILIAVAVFVMLLVPITKSLITAMSSSSTSKETQYRNDYAQNIMEYIKTDSIKNILKGTYFTENGSSSFSATKTTAADGSTTAPYVLTGKVRLGTDHTEYDYRVEIDSAYYAEKAAESAKAVADGTLDASDQFLDPNSSDFAFGVVEDFDVNKVALIDGTRLANYDTDITKEFHSAIVEKYRISGSDKYDIYMSQSTGFVFTDSVKRQITIRVFGSESSGYTVVAVADYVDDDAELGGTFVPNDDNHIRKTLLNSTYTDLPNIYLQYNPFHYGQYYASDDYIVFDCTGVTDDTKVNFFVVESAEQYSENITDTYDDLKSSGSTSDEDKTSSGSSGSSRVFQGKEGTTVLTRDAVKIHMVGLVDATDASSSEYSALEKMAVYHNLYNIYDDAGNVTNANKKNDLLLYDATTDSVDDIVDSFVSNFQNYNDPDLTLTTKVAKPLLCSDVKKSATIGKMTSANQDTRNLYTVKIWLEESSIGIDTSKEPTLQGTKGGGES